ncbi:MAG: hypothetical protein EOO45_06110 [Flavobacterium sp.]|nr:MAG: hypothetical protein EOO45_06110 [Flavobacterium sp.]
MMIMVMIRDNVLTRYLTIGLISFLLGSVAACNKKTDQAMEGEFYFINNTSRQISFSAGFEKYNLAPNERSTVFKVSDISDKSISEDSFYVPFLKEESYKLPNEPIIINFGNNRCLIVHDMLGNRNPLNIKSYSSERLAERKFKFTYTFTEADYSAAPACP